MQLHFPLLQDFARRREVGGQLQLPLELRCKCALAQETAAGQLRREASEDCQLAAVPGVHVGGKRESGGRQEEARGCPQEVFHRFLEGGLLDLDLDKERGRAHVEGVFREPVIPGQVEEGARGVRGICLKELVGENGKEKYIRCRLNRSLEIGKF